MPATRQRRARDQLIRVYLLFAGSQFERRLGGRQRDLGHERRQIENHGDVQGKPPPKGRGPPGRRLQASGRAGETDWGLPQGGGPGQRLAEGHVIRHYRVGACGQSDPVAK